MAYYASKDYNDDGYRIGLTEFNRKTALETYRKWKKDMDLSYGRMYLVSDNDFGEKTVLISNLFVNSLNSFATTDTLTTEQRWKEIRNIDEFFFANWLNKAHDEILRYNSGIRNEKKLSPYDYDDETRFYFNKLMADSTTGNLKPEGFPYTKDFYKFTYRDSVEKAVRSTK